MNRNYSSRSSNVEPEIECASEMALEKYPYVPGVVACTLLCVSVCMAVCGASSRSVLLHGFWGVLLEIMLAAGADINFHW